jgi:diaphanous 1
VKRLKPFFWNKLSTPGDTTVWGESSASVPLDMSDLEATFIIDDAKVSASQVKTTASKKQTTTTLLDISRAQNVGIMLTRMKMAPVEIKRAVLEVNDNKLSIDDLKAISKQLPSLEEVSLV